MATLSKPSLSINHDHNKKLAKVMVTGKITYSEYELNQMKDGLKFKLKCALWGEDSGLTGADDHLYTLSSKYLPDASPAAVENYKFEVTLGEGVVKHTARKIRRLYSDKILAGFAGSTADAFSLFSRFEAKLEQYHGNIGRAAVELAKDWRTDKFLRHLEALLLVSDAEQTFLLSGQGDVIEPDGGIAAIGSGGPYAQAAAQALCDHTQLSARQVAEEAMKIAGKMCIYTNDKVTVEEL